MTAFDVKKFVVYQFILFGGDATRSLRGMVVQRNSAGDPIVGYAPRSEPDLVSKIEVVPKMARRRGSYMGQSRRR